MLIVLYTLLLLSLYVPLWKSIIYAAIVCALTLRILNRLQSKRTCDALASRIASEDTLWSAITSTLRNVIGHRRQGASATSVERNERVRDTSPTEIPVLMVSIDGAEFECVVGPCTTVPEWIDTPSARSGEGSPTLRFWNSKEMLPRNGHLWYIFRQGDQAGPLNDSAPTKVDGTL